jgi:hypothetical protein
MFPPNTGPLRAFVSNGVHQTGNRVPRVLHFAKKGQICVNCPRLPTPDRKLLVRASYRHLSPNWTSFRTPYSCAQDVPDGSGGRSCQTIVNKWVTEKAKVQD